MDLIKAYWPTWQLRAMLSQSKALQPLTFLKNAAPARTVLLVICRLAPWWLRSIRMLHHTATLKLVLPWYVWLEHVQLHCQRWRVLSLMTCPRSSWGPALGLLIPCECHCVLQGVWLPGCIPPGSSTIPSASDSSCAVHVPC